jgi:hypothetical protein
MPPAPQGHAPPQPVEFELDLGEQSRSRGKKPLPP